MLMNGRKCSTLDHLFTTYGGKIIVEDFLVGEEVSFTVLFDGTHYIPMAESRDYKNCMTATKDQTLAVWVRIPRTFQNSISENYRPVSRTSD
ncbi:hypothetical protein HG619_19475 [Pseudomonas syringae]|nr:hypothetical protein [Pseudomonas syringae]